MYVQHKDKKIDFHTATLTANNDIAIKQKCILNYIWLSL